MDHLGDFVALKHNSSEIKSKLFIVEHSFIPLLLPKSLDFILVLISKHMGRYRKIY